MVVLTDLLSPRHDATWELAKQCGVDDVVTLLDGGEQDQRMFASVGAARPSASSMDHAPWSKPALSAYLEAYTSRGLSVVGVEDNPPLDLARTGAAGRDAQIDAFITQVRAMGELGIPLLCYNWMALTSWSRTEVERVARGGALVTAYDELAADALPAISGVDELTEARLWDSLRYFLAAVLPVAEEYGVRLALHPDDPPRAIVRRIPRIVTSADAYRRLFAAFPSPSNGLTFCQGNFALMDDPMPALITEFAADDRIAFSHFRDVRGGSASFEETFHDQSPETLIGCLEAYREGGFDGPLRADHVPTMFGESNSRPGYGTLGRLFALGYIRGLQHALDRR